MTREVEAVAQVLDEWAAARQELAELERDEHPDITDRHGRVWTWKSGDLYTHDDTLALPRVMVEHPRLGLPSPSCANDLSYSRLCSICRSGWSS